MVRSVEEVKERLREGYQDAKKWSVGLWWEFRGKILAQFLEKEDVERILGWEIEDYKPQPLTKEEILRQMREYFDFAVEKCINERGISAERSIAHYEEWIWLLGDDKFLDKLKGVEYYPYGEPKLIKIAEEYGFNARELVA